MHLDIKPDRTAEWGGAAELSGASVAMPELASPVETLTGSLQFQGSRAALLNASGKAGKIKWNGEFRWDSESDGPVQFRLKVPEAAADAIERELLPLLKREQGFIARTLRSPVTPPEWLDSRNADGLIEIALLHAADLTFESITGRLQWAGTKATLSRVTARWSGASIKAKGAIDVTRSLPVYRVSAEVENWPSRQGTASASFDLDAAGTGNALLAGLRAKGALEAAQLGAEVREISGGFEFANAGGTSKIKLTDMVLVTAKETYQAQTAASIEGKLQIDLISGRKSARLTGYIQPLQFEFSETRAAN